MSTAPFSVMAKPVGSRCNLNCGYCYYLKTPEQSRGARMTDEILETFIRQYIEASPGPEINFVWHGGEPALAGLDFYKRALELQQKYLPPGWSCWNNLQTNGVLLDDEWCDFLAAARFDIGLSVDGTERLHDRNRCGTYAAAVGAVRRLQARGVQPDLLCTVTAETAKEPVAIYRALKNLGTGWLQFIPIVRRADYGQTNGTTAVTPDSVTGGAYGNFLCAVFDEWAANDLGRVNVQMFAETARVWAGNDVGLCWMAPDCGRVLVVEADGGVYSCDHFVNAGHRIGNILSAHLGELADSEKQKNFGEKKRGCLPAQCKACEFLPACNGGCPKDRFNVDEGAANAANEAAVPPINFLCAGLKKFFTHSKPILNEMTRMANTGQTPAAIMAANRARFMEKWKGIGRNDPCPCGSGKKAKMCCWNSRP